MWRVLGSWQYCVLYISEEPSQDAEGERVVDSCVMDVHFAEKGNAKCLHNNGKRCRTSNNGVDYIFCASKLMFVVVGLWNSPTTSIGIKN